jgi:peptide/nickel transport system substrate-binding protein
MNLFVQKRGRTRDSSVCVALLVVLLLAACGGQATTPAPEDTAAETPEQAAGPAGTLRYGFQSRFLTWDPHQEQRPIVLTGYNLVYDALLAEDIDGSLMPGLATEWNQTLDMVELTLREGVVFHDGTPFDAEVAQANLERARDEGAPPIAQQLASIESVEVLDTYQLRLNLAAPTPDLLYNLARSAGMMMSPDAFETAATQPVGTGPWAFNAEESTADVAYVFDVFPDFWEPQQQGLERVVLQILPDPAARLSALRSGDIHATAFLPVEDFATLEDEGFTLITNDAVYMGLHLFDREGTIAPELADERVRRAISHALDREPLVDVLSSGYGEPVTQRFQAGQYGHAADIADLGYDPERARALLAEAEAETLELSIPALGTAESEILAIAGLLQEVGITLNIETIAPGTLIQEASSGNWAIAYLPINEPHVSTYIANRVQANGFLNPFGVEDPELEALIDEARQLPAAEAEPLWAELARETAEQGIIVHLTAIPSLIFAAPEVRGGSVGHLQPNVFRLRGVTIEE